MNTQNQFSNDSEKEGVVRSGSSRKYIYGVIVLIVIIAVILVVRSNEPKTTVLEDGTKIINQQVTNLSATERKLLESQLAGFTEQLKNLGGDDFIEQRNSIYYKTASAQAKLGMYKDALDNLDRISSQDSYTVRIWALKINIYRDMGDKEKALDAANNALKLDRENPSYWLAVIEFSGVSNDDKKKMYEDALKLTQNDIDIVLSYAKFLESIGDKSGAISFWQKAGQIDDKNKAQYDAEVARLQK